MITKSGEVSMAPDSELARFVDDGEMLNASIYFAATFVGAVVAFYLGTWLTTMLLRPQV